MTVKADKELRELVYRMCNGLKRESDICDYLMLYHKKDFPNRKITEISVRYHISKLESDERIYIKRDGRILDLAR